MKLARLHIGEERTTIAFDGDGAPARTVVLALGTLGVCQTYFHHDPPTPHELEGAIAAIEDELMPVVRSLPDPMQLVTSDPETMDIARASGTGSDRRIELDLSSVERMFNRLVSVAHGRPASSEGIPSRATFAANLVILRELMHHAGIATTMAEPPA